MKKCGAIALCLAAILAVFPVSAAEKTLVIWSHWGAEPIKVNFLEVVIEEFENAHGVNVEIIWKPKNELKEELKKSYNTPVPDLTYVDAGFSHARISGSLLDLSDLNITADVLAGWGLGSVGEGSNNFLPIEGVSGGIYYNRDVFAKANIELPADRAVTTEEFLDIVQTLRAEGITPIAEGTADVPNGKMGMPVINVIFRFAGPEKTLRFINGKLPASDPDVVAALTYWKQVVDAQGYDPEQPLSLTLVEGILEMVEGQAGMNFCGTWIYSKFGATEHDRGQVGVLDWVTVENGKGNASYEQGWAAGYGINKNSENQEEAKQFLEFLMTPRAASLWLQHVQGPYPVVIGEVPEDSLYGALLKQRTTQQPVTTLFSYPDFGSKAVGNMWEEEVRKLILGEHTVEQFVEKMNSRLKIR